MSISIEPRVKRLIAVADGAAWLTAPADSTIAGALAEADLVGSKDDLVEQFKATIELAQRIIDTIERTDPAT